MKRPKQLIFISGEFSDSQIQSADGVLPYAARPLPVSVIDVHSGIIADGRRAAYCHARRRRFRERRFRRYR